MPASLQTAMVVAQRACCAICGANQLEIAIELPQLPLTGIFCPEPPRGPTLGINQQLLVCPACGHGQLAEQVAPELFYGTSYSFRTSVSHTATQGTAFFLSALETIAPGRTFDCVLDVGCNDLYLLKQLKGRAHRRVGIDPIWEGKEDQCDDQGITVIGSTIENIDLKAAIGTTPDLIVCRHTLEHIQDPRRLLEQLFEVADDTTLFLIEVPGFEALVRRLHFDQVFHQHLQYFNLASFHRLLQGLGGTYVAHKENYHDWGALLVAFVKRKANQPPDGEQGSWFDVGTIRRRYTLFQRTLSAVREELEGLDGTVYGYGAAAMLPVLAYHLGTDLSALTAVLDDDPAKDGLYYSNLPVPIRHSRYVMDLECSSVLLTAIENVKPIMSKLLVHRPRHIVCPLHII